jgi:hypothetical protein
MFPSDLGIQYAGADFRKTAGYERVYPEVEPESELPEHCGGGIVFRVTQNPTDSSWLISTRGGSRAGSLSFHRNGFQSSTEIFYRWVQISVSI